MKGQYLAIESVLSLGIGLAIAVGTISIFTGYKADVLETSQQKQMDVVESEMISSVYGLKNVKSGRTTIELPERVGGESYTISFNQGMMISTRTESQSSTFRNLKHEYSFTGSASGGTVNIFKRDNEYILEDS